jgi:hypothetical protein
MKLSRLALLAAAATLGGPLTGQAIKGTVYGPSGGLVPGARVVLLQDFSKKAETATDSEGKFTFSGLDIGQHDVVGKAADYDALIRSVLVREERTGRLNLIPRTGSVTLPFFAGTAAPAPPAGARAAVPCAPPVAPPLKRLRVIAPARPRDPAGAAPAGIAGQVVMRARWKTGRTLEIVHVLASRDAELEAEARRAAGEVRIEPFMLGDKAIEAEAGLIFEFRLEEK